MLDLSPAARCQSLESCCSDHLLVRDEQIRPGFSTTFGRAQGCSLAPLCTRLRFRHYNRITHLVPGLDLANEHAIGGLYYEIGLVVLPRLVLDLELPFTRLDPFLHGWLALDEHREPPLRIGVEFL